MIEIENIYLGLIYDETDTHQYQAIIVHNNQHWYYLDNNQLINLNNQNIVKDALVPLVKYLKEYNIVTNPEVDAQNIRFIIKQIKSSIDHARTRSF